VLYLYRLCLLLLPPGFRRQFGTALVDEAAARLREGRGSGVAVGLRLAVDLAATLAREWWDVLIMETRSGLGGGVMTDLKWALRGLRRSPGFALAVVAMLALGIGVSTVALGLTNAYLIKSLPYPRGDRLVAVWPEENWSNQMMDLGRESLHSLQGLAANGGALLVLQDGGEPEEIFVETATTNLFDVVGVHPALGRGFVPDDGDPGAAPVAILSHRLWADRFGADSSVVGTSIALGGDGQLRRTVVGVMPEEYLPLYGKSVDAWVPVVVDRAAESYGDSYFMTAVGRLGPGATPAAAQKDLNAFSRRMAEVSASWFTPERIRKATAVPLAADRTGDRRTPVLLALAAALLVLLVACANVTNLIVARTTGRERELSVRAALGAGRLRTVRTLLAEVVTLAAAGAVAGFALAYGLVALLERYYPNALPEWGLSLDVRWSLGAVLLAVAAAFLAGLVPALQAGSRDPARSMSGGRGTSGRTGLARLQELLSAAQLALATAGVAAMGLLGRSLNHLDHVDPGLDTGHTLTFRVSAPPAAYPEDGDVVRFYREAGAALADVPGVEAVGFGSRLPLAGGDSRITVQPEGMEFQEGDARPVAWLRLVTPGYLEALGTHLVEGRIPTAADDQDSLPELAVINRAAAQAYWPGQSVVGKRFYGPGHKVWLTVAGVVDDVMENGQTAPVLPGLYIPHRDWAWRSMYAAVRTRGEPSELLPALKNAIWSVSAGAPVSRVKTLTEVMGAGLRPTRTLAILATLAGAVTLLLGALGTYGVVSHAVARRVREIGVRAALGASRDQLLRGELGRATRIIAAGMVGGFGLAWITGRALQGVLFGVGPLDVASFLLALVLLAAVGYLAAYVPARRAAGVDPVTVMREE